MSGVARWVEGAGGRKLGTAIAKNGEDLVPGREQKNKLASYTALVLLLDRGVEIHQAQLADRYRIGRRTVQRWLRDIDRYAFPLERRDGLIRKAKSPGECR